MMRKRIVLIAAALLLGAVSVQAAERKDLDFKDYDDELMKTLEQTNKYFEPDIGGGNKSGVKEDADILADGFRYTRDYFTKKGNAADAVQWSQEGLEYIATAVKDFNAGNLDEAAAAARGATQSCKSCHEVYKPNKAR